MDDFSALAQRISVSVREVRGCLILSRDGLVLGAFPEEAETLAKAAWLKFVTLGEPERSFVEFVDQVWAYAKRSSYAAFAVADGGCRPGILVDQLEQILITAEEARVRRDTLRLPDASLAPSGKPRTSLHPPADRPQPAEPAEVVTQTTAEALTALTDQQGHWRRDPPLTPADVGASGAGPALAQDPTPIQPQPGDSDQPSSTLSKEPKKLVSSDDGEAQKKPNDGAEVDRVLLAQEFSGLLQVDKGDDEVSS
jgi:hypothetical protein